MSTPFESTILPGACLVSSAGDLTPHLLGGAGPGISECREGMDPGQAHNLAAAGSSPAPAPNFPAESLETLARYLRRAGHLVEGALETMGLGLNEHELVRAGYLRAVLGPGLADTDWLIPQGPLLHLVRDHAGGAVEATWANYRERLDHGCMDEG